jgi:hypothetical protein
MSHHAVVLVTCFALAAGCSSFDPKMVDGGPPGASRDDAAGGGTADGGGGGDAGSGADAGQEPTVDAGQDPTSDAAPGNCGGEGQQCCATEPACTGGEFVECAGATCQSCGGVGESCCLSGPQCEGGDLTCNLLGVCVI